VKLLFDTNVYFHLLHDRRVLDRYREILAKVSPRLHLSSVVLLELIQGARGELSRARIRRAVRELERVGRVVAPLHTDWQRAGDVQGRIWDEHPNRLRQSLQNDLLIACTAMRIGAMVVTQNTADFRFIRRYLRHDSLTLDELAASIEQ
jgi:predicted nucleic acid-binding protein